MKNRRCVIPFEMTKSLRFALRFKEESHLLGLQRRSSKPGFWEVAGGVEVKKGQVCLYCICRQSYLFSRAPAADHRQSAVMVLLSW